MGHDNNNTTERAREISKLTRAGHEDSHEVSHEVLCPIWYYARYGKYACSAGPEGRLARRALIHT